MRLQITLNFRANIRRYATIEEIPSPTGFRTFSFKVIHHLTNKNGNIVPGAVATLVDELAAVIQVEGRPVDVSIDMSINYLSTAKMEFTFVLAGWEGSAYDSRLLRSATLRQGHRLTIPVGKYYLVDAGFPLVPGFLTPYHRTRIYDAEDLCDEDYYSSDDEVNLGHVDALEDDTPNAPISFTAEAAWSSNRDTMADDMWAAYHPTHDAGIDFD
ncbi:unnamed protein product [Fraxinus pennsylvanica]|uniref:DDE Tnp4 domain-containing protein n=1 Tax=Fraxinus pennsylvanica TaxID=56036 RepID=A0AAD2A011_9LAMI|nr:unnamed protein product [Fraxinus pennsylvanica]